MKMKIACIAGSALGLTAAANAQLMDHNMGAAGKPVASAHGEAGQMGIPRDEVVAELFYDGNSTFGSAAQDFEEINDAFDISVIEDFSISEDAELTTGYTVGFACIIVDGVCTPGNPFGTTDVIFTIWEDNGSGFPCDPGYTGEIVAESEPGAGFYDGLQFNTEFPAGTCLPAGDYFVEMAVQLDFDPHGQIFLFQQEGEHTVGGGEPNNAQHWNPGGGFNLPNLANCNPIDDDAGAATGINFSISGDPGECDGGGCPIDFNGSGGADVGDFFMFLDFFASGDMRADVDGSGNIDVNDFFAFLDIYASPACSG